MSTENAPGGKVPDKKADDAVLNAFSQSFDSDSEFRERWKSTVEQAEKRREERKLAEAERQRRERERIAKTERDQKPRVTDENRPGKPMDIRRLSEISDEMKAAEAESEAQKKEEEIPEEPEPEDFRFDEAAAGELPADAENAAAPVGPIVPPSTKDKNVKKKFREKTAFFFRTRFSKNGFKRFVHRNFPVKGDDTSEVIRKCIRCASFIALIGALGFLGNYLVDYVHRINETSSFEDEMSALDNIGDDELEDAWAKIRAQYPDIVFPEGMNIKFSELYAMNQHVVGWLKIDNTNISTVLLQAEDNNYHLKHNLYDEYTRFGNPFVHYACKMGKDGFSKNTILFGHNANDGLMFHDLIDYMTVEGYLDAPIVTLDTLYGQTKWKIFAVVLTNSHPSEDNGRVWQYLYPEFNSTSHFERVLSEINQRTIIHTGVDVKDDDLILTLYTCCTYQLDSGRLAVFARQLREGESEDIDTARVYYNQNARYPQTWYDRKGKVNPYADPSETTTKKPEETTTAKPSGDTTEAASGDVTETPATEAEPSDQTTEAEPATAPPETSAPAAESQQTEQEPSGDTSD